MDEVLTERQRELRTKARDMIAKNPEGYDQDRYGMGFISCNTPACVAGHIVASDPGLREELLRQLEGENLSGSDGIETIGSAVNLIACSALGTPDHQPHLFRSAWPIGWLEGPSADAARNQGEDTFVPTADDAVAVINKILDGEIGNGLRSGMTSAGAYARGASTGGRDPQTQKHRGRQPQHPRPRATPHGNTETQKVPRKRGKTVAPRAGHPIGQPNQVASSRRPRAWTDGSTETHPTTTGGVKQRGQVRSPSDPGDTRQDTPRTPQALRRATADPTARSQSERRRAAQKRASSSRLQPNGTPPATLPAAGSDRRKPETASCGTRSSRSPNMG